MLALAVLGIGLALIGIGVAVSGLLSTIFITAGVVVSLAAPFIWLRGTEQPSPPSNPPPKRTGVINRKTGHANLSDAQIRNQDIAIDNAGEIDAENVEIE